LDGLDAGSLGPDGLRHTRDLVLGYTATKDNSSGNLTVAAGQGCVAAEAGGGRSVQVAGADERQLRLGGFETHADVGDCYKNIRVRMREAS